MEAYDEELTYENVIEEFLFRFPEFKDKAEEEKEWWWYEDNEEPLPHIFFSNVLHDFLIYEIKQTRTQCFCIEPSFFERMPLSPDDNVADLLTTGTLEYLGDDKWVLDRARKMMGKETLKLSHYIERLLGRE